LLRDAGHLANDGFGKGCSALSGHSGECGEGKREW
jgi:hypothetical protein